VKKITIYTDGACSGNPGPGGWGAVLLCPPHIKEISGFSILSTNNIMELTAAIEALKLIKSGYAIEIYTDSKYVMNGITTWIANWKKNNWLSSAKKPIKNQELWQELDKLNAQHQPSWHWIKGHSGDKYNDMADSLAVAAIQKAIGA
jgi:ribonuclease HI